MQTVQLVLRPEEAAQPHLWYEVLSRQTHISVADLRHVRIVHRSTDARSAMGVKVLQTVALYTDMEYAQWLSESQIHYPMVHAAPEVIVVGSGPAGLFTSLRLIEHGLRPILLERGKEVGARKKDIAQLSRGNGLNPESNYCFGEGGAGTFSDGKLYTRSSKRGDIQRVLQVFFQHGAPETILYDAHPHIGSDKLPEIVRHMRRTILDSGGTVLFETKVTSIRIKDHAVCGVETDAHGVIPCSRVVWAAGQAAHGMYEWFRDKGIALEAKPFAVGVRVEHPQALIDETQYHKDADNTYLPAASYTLKAQVDGRGVYSFCMCPGGYLVASSSEADGQVVNGMSSSRRHTPYANAGIVTEVSLADLQPFAAEGPLAGLRYQQHLEHLAKMNGGGNQVAPAQRLTDFVRRRMSSSLPLSSYVPGLLTSPVHFWLPEEISQRLAAGFQYFETKMRGFLTSEAIVVGVETRSSSPVRIPRDDKTYQHPEVKGLYPCGEGAGYAGGITSSAMDGENVADVIDFEIHG